MVKLMEISKERLTLFTDAIIAIAATIMVLELSVPLNPTIKGAFSQWPIFIAYFNSFVLIYLSWFKHQNLFNKINSISMKMFLLNGIWVFLLTLIPFTTAWIGDCLYEPLTQFTYAILILLFTVSFHMLDLQAIRENPNLKLEFINEKRIRIFNYISLIIAIVVSLFLPILCILIILFMSFVTILVLYKKYE